MNISSFKRGETIHGGSSIYVRNDIEADEAVEIKKKSVEGHIECSSIVSKKLKILMICIYRPPMGDLILFYDILFEILNICQNKFIKYKILICGDFNINLLEESLNSRKLLDIFLVFNFLQTIFQPTRISKNAKSCLDNIFINFENENLGSVELNALSDHAGLLLEINLVSEPEYDPIPHKRRIFSMNKIEQYRQQLQNTNWDNLYEASDPNCAYDIFLSTLRNLLNLIFKPKIIKTSISKNKSWITKGIKTSCKNKRRLYKKMVDGKISLETYKIYSKTLKLVIREAKKNANINYLKTSVNKAKAVWSLVNNYTGTKKSKSHSVFSHISPENANKKKVLDDINNFFISACPDSNTSGNTISQVKINKTTLFLQPTTANEVYNTIMSLKNTKSVGEDEIPVLLLKQTAEVISHPLTHIINLILASGTFPKKLKVAHIKPIYKKGDKDVINNYRPIALLNNISKIVEKIIYNRLICFIENQNILSDYQNGFRKQRTTTRAIYQALCEILDSLNKGKETLTMCLDLSKAFDSVDHTLLIDKLESYGIRGIASNLIKSYLHERTQCVIERNNLGQLVKSEPLIVKKGVPQGSILGPLLYIIYTNEVPSLTTHKTILFADDTSIIITEPNFPALENEVFHTLNTLNEWFEANNLRLNIDKTQVMKFSYRNVSEDLIFTNGNQEIHEVKKLTFLGVNIDSRLDWKHHIDVLAKSMAKYCYALKVISQHINIETAIMTYHAYVHSRMRYGIIFWGNSTHANRVFILQKRCLRNILNLKQTDSCKHIFKQRNILTFTALFIYESIIFVKENDALFEKRSHNHDTRNNHSFTSTISRYSYIQKNAPHTLIQIFNKLPEQLKNLPTKSLKPRLKQILTQKAYYTIDEYLYDGNII